MFIQPDNLAAGVVEGDLLEAEFDAAPCETENGAKHNSNEAIDTVIRSEVVMIG